MTTHELQLVALGAGLGSNLTLLLWIGLERVSDRGARRRAAARRAERAAAGSRAEPHPAELVEASVRDFELNLYDGLDQVEDATRRDGLL